MDLRKRGLLAALLAAVLVVPVSAQVIINEVDADTPSTDILEFVELYDGGVGSTDLTGLVLVLYNGSNDTSYGAYDLDGYSTNGSGYFVIGNAGVANVDYVISNGVLQNGADAVALYTGDDTDFPSSTPVTTTNLIDAVVYDTNDSDDSGLLVLITAGGQLNEDGAGDKDNHSNQRCPNGGGAARDTSGFVQAVATPGAANDCVAETGGCCDDTTGICTDGVTAVDCTALGNRWAGANVLCADIDPPCEAPILGACCDDVTGVCEDDIEEDPCFYSGRRWGGDGSECATLDPPCEAAPMGACCYAGFCADDVAEVDCTADGGTYMGDASTCAGVTCPEGPAILINEIRTDQPGTDYDEYFELVGDPGASLDGLTYIVLGDGSGASGVIEFAMDLTGNTIPADGYLLVGRSSLTLGTPDVIKSTDFENSDNVTHILVAGFVGSLQEDLDTDDDGVLDVTPWAGQLDLIALVESENPPSGTEYHYGPPSIGPVGGYAPSHVYRCPDGWAAGEYDPTLSVDTPGDVNPCQQVPAAGPLGLAILSLVVAGAGTATIRSRKRKA